MQSACTATVGRRVPSAPYMKLVNWQFRIFLAEIILVEAKKNETLGQARGILMRLPHQQVDFDPLASNSTTIHPVLILHYPTKRRLH